MVVGMLLIMALCVGYEYFLNYEYSRHPQWTRAGQDNTAQTAPSISSNGVPATTLPSVVASTQSGWRIMAGPASTQPVRLGSDQYQDSHFRMGLEVNPAGAAIDLVELNRFHETVDDPGLFKFQTPYDSQWDLSHSSAAIAVTVDGVRLDLGDKNFSMDSRAEDGESADFSAIVYLGDTPVVRVVKEFSLDKASTDPASSEGYEIRIKYRMDNLTDQRHTASLEFSGPTMPQAETARQDTEIVAGYDNQGLVKVEHQTVSSFTKSSPSKDFSTAAQPERMPLLWLGASSNYFNAVVHFEESKSIATAVVSAFDPTNLPGRVGIRFDTTVFDLAPSSSASVPMLVYFGPKMRSVLQSKYYSSFPMEYDQTLVLTSGICSVCTFPWLINLLVNFLAGLHWLLGDWGLAIIAMVLCVRLLLHPITKKSQVSMMKMQKLAPEMERLKKKFGDDKDGFQKAQMDLYKNVGFTPILGCLPMFLQMPIFIALWRALQTTFELRQSPFLYFGGVHFTWIHDLAQPDFLIKFSTPVHLLFFTFAGLNVLPLAMAVVTFINTKYFTPRPAVMSPEQEQQQKMMTWMTLVFPFMFYGFPSGLNLYYLTSTTLGILESKHIRNHIRKAEAEEAAHGPVIVDAGKLSRQTRRQEVAAVPAKKGFWASMQQRIEDAQREAQKRNKKKL